MNWRLPLALGAALCLVGGFAIGQNTPFIGQAVYNQVMAMRAVTPSDTANLTQTAKAIFNGGATACNIALVAAQDQAGGQQTMQNIPAGTWLPVSAWRVMATGTTCTNILAGY
jgi:hypothetical protein